MKTNINNIFFVVIITFLTSCREKVIKTYYPNGSLEMTIEVKNDLNNGFSKYYYKSGKIKEIGKYKNGVPIDSSIVYYDLPGQKLKRIKYWNNDTLFYVKQYDTIGQLISEGKATKKGKKIGVWKEYFKNEIAYQTYFNYNNFEYINNNVFINSYGDTIKGKGFYYLLQIDKNKVKIDEEIHGFITVKWSNLKNNYNSKIELYLPKYDSINFNDDFSNWQEIEKIKIDNNSDCINHYKNIDKEALKYYICFKKKFKIKGTYNFRGVLKEYYDSSNESMWRYYFFNEKIFVD